MAKNLVKSSSWISANRNNQKWPASPVQTDFIFTFYLFYLFIYFWLCWVFVAARGLSLVAASGGYSSLRRAGFSLRWLLVLQSVGSRRTGSVVVARGL